MEELKEMLMSLRIEMQRISEEDRQRNERLLVRIGVLESREPMMVKTEERKESAEGSSKEEPSRMPQRSTPSDSTLSREGIKSIPVDPKTLMKKSSKRRGKGDRDSLLADDESPMDATKVQQKELEELSGRLNALKDRLLVEVMAETGEGSGVSGTVGPSEGSGSMVSNDEGMKNISLVVPTFCDEKPLSRLQAERSRLLVEESPTAYALMKEQKESNAVKRVLASSTNEEKQDVDGDSELNKAVSVLRRNNDIDEKGPDISDIKSEDMVKGRNSEPREKNSKSSTKRYGLDHLVRNDVGSCVEIRDDEDSEEEELSCFTGKRGMMGAIEWLNSLERRMELIDPINDISRILVVTTHLRDTAMHWYLVVGRQFTTYEEFRGNFLLQFTEVVHSDENDSDYPNDEDEQSLDDEDRHQFNESGKGREEDFIENKMQDRDGTQFDHVEKVKTSRGQEAVQMSNDCQTAQLRLRPWEIWEGTEQTVQESIISYIEKHQGN